MRCMPTICNDLFSTKHHSTKFTSHYLRGTGLQTVPCTAVYYHHAVLHYVIAIWKPAQACPVTLAWRRRRRVEHTGFFDAVLTSVTARIVPAAAHAVTTHSPQPTSRTMARENTENSQKCFLLTQFYLRLSSSPCLHVGAQASKGHYHLWGLQVTSCYSSVRSSPSRERQVLQCL